MDSHSKIIRTSYQQADTMQEETLKNVINGDEDSLMLFELEDVYTAGTSANIETDYINKDIPLVKTGRGGQITYHGKGQIVAYPIINLNNRNKDLKEYVKNLQQWIINTLKHFDIESFTADEVGVWVDTPTGRKKIAAVGIRVRKWVTFHGIALNVSPDLEKFNGIVPCGIKGFGVTSIAELLNKDITIEDIANKLEEEFYKIF